MASRKPPKTLPGSLEISQVIFTRLQGNTSCYPTVSRRVHSSPQLQREPIGTEARTIEVTPYPRDSGETTAGGCSCRLQECARPPASDSARETSGQTGAYSHFSLGKSRKPRLRGRMRAWTPAPKCPFHKPTHRSAASSPDVARVPTPVSLFQQQSFRLTPIP